MILRFLSRLKCAVTGRASIAFGIALATISLSALAQAQVHPLFRQSRVGAYGTAGENDSNDLDTTTSFATFESNASGEGTDSAGSGSGAASQFSKLELVGDRLLGITANGLASASATATIPTENGASAGSTSEFSLEFRVETDSVGVKIGFSLTSSGTTTTPNAGGYGGALLRLATQSGETILLFAVTSDETPFHADNLEVKLGPGDYILSVECIANCIITYDDGTVSVLGGFDLVVEFENKMYIKVVDGLNNPVNNTTLQLAKVHNDPPAFTETDLGTVETDSTGTFVLPVSIQTGDSIKISKVIYSEPAKKHLSILGTMYSISVDNAGFDDLGNTSFYEVLDSTEQTIKLDHTTVAWNLVIAIEWDVASQYLLRTRAAVRAMSNYLYDVTDGQSRLDTVLIFDNKEHWAEADFQIFASNIIHPHVDAVAGIYHPPGSESDPVEMPRYWNGNPDASRNFVFSDEALDVSDVVEYRTRVHEFGHYGLTFGDEYVFTNSAGQCAAVANYGFMDTHYESSGSVYSTEMSSANRYALPACQNTDQWDYHAFSCWDVFEIDFERWYGDDSIFAKIIMPQERELPPLLDYLLGPNNFTGALSYDVGAKVVMPGVISPPAASTLLIGIMDPVSGSFLPNIAVGTELPNGTIISQGLTSDLGALYVLGASASTIISASGAVVVVPSRKTFPQAFTEKTWYSGQFVYDGSASELQLPLHSVSGSFPFNLRVNLNSKSTTVDLDIQTPFQEPPVLKHVTESGSSQSAFVSSANGYYGSVAEPLESTGEFRIEAIDDGDSAFFVSIPYLLHQTTFSGAEIRVSAWAGSALLSVDQANVSLSNVLMATSSYPVVRTGLDPASLQAGDAHSLALLGAAKLFGRNDLTIRYQDSDLPPQARNFVEESSLRIHHWDSDSLKWFLVSGGVDTVHNEVTASITQSGVYAAFTTEVTTGFDCGDADGSNDVNVSDIVFLVNYIFNDGPAPPNMDAADADCDNDILVTDAVYLVQYIFNDGPPPCAICQ